MPDELTSVDISPREKWCPSVSTLRDLEMRETHTYRNTFGTATNKFILDNPKEFSDKITSQTASGLCRLNASKVVASKRSNGRSFI